MTQPDYAHVLVTYDISICIQIRLEVNNNVAIAQDFFSHMFVWCRCVFETV